MAPVALAKMNRGWTLSIRYSLMAMLVLAAIPQTARTETSEPVRIGVLNDQSGLYADLGGPGSVIAARMAVEDFGGKVLGRPIEVIFADHQNKPDVAVAIARRWFDADNVAMVVGFDNSAVALAVEQLASDRNRIAIAGAVGTTAYTGSACTPTEAAWVHDTHALTTSLARSVVAEGRDTWFFITVDYAFGHSLEADASRAVREAGGTVLGSVRHPLNTSDFGSYLLQAQASGAKVVAFANSGGDMINAIKQANEFGLTTRQSVVALLLFITDVHSIGLQATQGLKFITAFYWDRNDETRAWSRRFFALHHRMPTMAQAGAYSSVLHYLRAIEAAATLDARDVMAKLRTMPVDDFYTHGGQVREDGRMIHDMYFAQIKRPAESAGEWDYYKILTVIPGRDAFRALNDSGCPLVAK